MEKVTVYIRNKVYGETIDSEVKMAVLVKIMKNKLVGGEAFWFLENIWLFAIPLGCSGNQVGFR